jgi:hypothetical protein
MTRHSQQLSLWLAGVLLLASASAACRSGGGDGGGGGGTVLCENTCASDNDGECDDGGEASDFDRCELGTDCNDCGPRTLLFDGGPADSNSAAYGDEGS